jgi:hypothetical protein
MMMRGTRLKIPSGQIDSGVLRRRIYYFKDACQT